jgi:1,6-anhydro-N-acetylmuramate kinase
MANAAVEITEKDHPARRVIEAHKAKLRTRLAELCERTGARKAALLADELFLLMEGAQVSTVLGFRGPARKVAHAADALIDSHLQGRRRA